MSELKETKVKEIKDTSVQDVPEELADPKHASVKRFNINVESGKDAEGNSQLFTFSGPEKASLGLIYDAIHRVMMEVVAILQKRAEELKPKTVEEKDTSVK